MSSGSSVGSGAAAGSGTDAGSGASSSGTSGTGASGSGTGSSSTGNSGTGSSGGSGSSSSQHDAGSFSVECVADAGGAQDLNPTVNGAAHGTNGAIVSACDPQGNLVEPVCEQQTVGGPGPNPGPTVYSTGKVVTKAIDCSGHCAGGVCDGRCPAQGDRFTCITSDGAGGVAINDDTVGRRYSCTILFSAPGFDCTNRVRAGVQGTIQGLTVSRAVTSGTSTYCTGKSFGNIPITIDGVSLASPYQNEACALGCDVPP